MLSRRALVSKLAAGAAGAAVAWVASPGKANALSVRKSPNQPNGFGRGDGQPNAEAGELPLQEERHAAARTETSVASGEVAEASAPAPVTAPPPPWALLRPLRKGSAVAHRWRVADLSAVVDGACVLTLRNPRGREHRIHLCRNDGDPQGLVYTDRLDLMVMNGGQGELPTEEGLAQAVAKVAHVLAANEGGRRQERMMVTLLTHAERVRQFNTLAGAKLR